MLEKEIVTAGPQETFEFLLLTANVLEANIKGKKRQLDGTSKKLSKEGRRGSSMFVLRLRR